MRYRVKVRYLTKRDGVCVGMEIEADDEGAAGRIACAKVITPYPARRLVSCVASALDDDGPTMTDDEAAALKSMAGIIGNRKRNRQGRRDDGRS